MILSVIAILQSSEHRTVDNEPTVFHLPFFGIVFVRSKNVFHSKNNATSYANILLLNIFCTG